MGKAEVKRMVLGPVVTNCYFLVNRDTKEMVLIDPAASAGRIDAAVKQNGYQPVAILLTHGHFDHMEALAALRATWQVPVYAAEKEKEVLASPDMNLSFSMGETTISTRADIWVHGEDELTLAGFTIRVISTPGHTKGSICFYLPEEKLLFSGDTLFEGSCGRTDFPGGSMAEIVQSIQKKLFVLPEDVRVLSGHGEETTIGLEKRYNFIASM